MIAQSDVLTDFYRAYVVWLDTGTFNTSLFREKDGLCTCLVNYLKYKGYSKSTIDRHTDELNDQFRKAGLDRFYPFNYGDGNYFANEHKKNMNRQRVTWAREHAKKY